MTDTLLRSLREHMLDESEPLAGLLRKCLLLGAETGSTSLRDWARKELKGYSDEDEVPEYRTYRNVPMKVDSVSGPTWTTGQLIGRAMMPAESRVFVPESVFFRQGVEELQQLAGQGTITFTTPGLGIAQAIWNRQLGAFQNIVNLQYAMSGSAVAGSLGEIRTQLVDVIADLTADTPLTELPGKELVDQAVSSHIGRVGDVYNTTINGTGGPVAIGTQAKASSEGLTIEDALRLLGEVSRSAENVDGLLRAELDAAVVDVTVALDQEEPDTGDIVKKAGKLRTIAERIGVDSVTAATSSAATMLTELALNGAFG